MDEMIIRWLRGLVAGLLLGLAGPLNAAPFLVSDQIQSTDGTPLDYAQLVCVYQEGTAAPVVSPVVDRACRFDMQNVAVGAHTLEVWIRRTDTVWGVADGPRVPFAYTRPSANVPAPTMRLVAQ